MSACSPPKLRHSSFTKTSSPTIKNEAFRHQNKKISMSSDPAKSRLLTVVFNLFCHLCERYSINLKVIVSPHMIPRHTHSLHNLPSFSKNSVENTDTHPPKPLLSFQVPARYLSTKSCETHMVVPPCPSFSFLS